MPSTDLEVLNLALEAWPAALSVMQAGGEHHQAAEMSRLFDSLTRWRRHRTVWIPVGPR